MNNREISPGVLIGVVAVAAVILIVIAVKIFHQPSAPPPQQIMALGNHLPVNPMAHKMTNIPVGGAQPGMDPPAKGTPANP